MQHQIVSRDEWLEAQTALLAREKAFTKAHDELSAERRALPWVKIEKPYVFDGPEGKVTMAELFDGRSQLFLKHLMMAPGQQSIASGARSRWITLKAYSTIFRTTTSRYVAVARAPITEIEVLRKRMGWRVPFVSAYPSSFNFDFNVSFTPEQMAAKGRATISGRPTPGSRICRAPACSTGTRRAKSSTPIRRSDAVTSSSSAPTASST